MSTILIRAILSAVVLTACASPSGDGGEDAGDPSAMYTALCDARSATDPAAAEDGFARAHDGLHSLARELQETDQRPVAGDLLEAKQLVEAAFEDDPPPTDLEQRLDGLLAASADAVEASGDPRPSCPGGTP